MSPSKTEDTRMPKALAVAMAATALALPALASISDSPSPRNPGVKRWYDSLRKPSFNPPKAAFPIAWTIIDSALAVGAYRLARKPASPQRNKALGWWAANVAMIGGWSKLFFGKRRLGASAATAAAMVGTGAAYVAAARPVDGKAAVSGVPFTAWVTFATVLSTTIWLLNRERGVGR